MARLEYYVPTTKCQNQQLYITWAEKFIFEINFSI